MAPFELCHHIAMSLNVQLSNPGPVTYPRRVGEPRWLTAEEQRAWRAYLESTVLLFDALDHQLQQDAGMPHGYYEILVRLSESPSRAMRMSELATQTRSSRNWRSRSARVSGHCR